MNDEFQMTNGAADVQPAIDDPGAAMVRLHAVRGSSRASDWGARFVRLCQALSDPRIFKKVRGRTGSRSPIFGDIRSNSPIFAHSGKKYFNHEVRAGSAFVRLWRDRLANTNQTKS